jgi:hypothetical protein
VVAKPTGALTWTYTQTVAGYFAYYTVSQLQTMEKAVFHTTVHLVWAKFLRAIRDVRVRDRRHAPSLSP